MILNDRKHATCVRAQGTSMVDVTIGTEKAAREVSEWGVDLAVETLSDHKYIRFRVAAGELVKKGRKGSNSLDGRSRSVTGTGTWRQ